MIHSNFPNNKCNNLKGVFTMSHVAEGKLLDSELLGEIREKFAYIDTDPLTKEARIFLDNAGGSFRLKLANERFAEIDLIPDHPMREHRTAVYLSDIEKQGIDDIRTIFNAKNGAIVPYYTASQAIFNLTGVVAEHVEGTNIVTTALEHPSLYDAAQFYADKFGKELRVAPTNKITGGVDVEEITKLIDKDTISLNFIYASNISGGILDVETIIKEAKKIKPDIYIIIDAVQHAPHGLIDLEKTVVDVINFAPYKFFGIRGVGFAYVSDRATHLPHQRLLGKSDEELGLGSVTPGHYAAISAVVDYVCWLGEKFTNTSDRRSLYEAGMTAISQHERALLQILLDGTESVDGLRMLDGVTVHLDYEDLSKRDFIVGISLEGIDYNVAVDLYSRENIIVYDRVASSIYSKRMLESFDMDGAIRISPMHCQSKEEILTFLKVTKKIVNS